MPDRTLRATAGRKGTTKKTPGPSREVPHKVKDDAPRPLLWGVPQASHQLGISERSTRKLIVAGEIQA
ncbi:MAG TPA: hypothetical protein VEJ84_21430, partial [Acidimicrobiales bacterium]|nr:hypothetical protein [Acidimicrobiales bacterium]